MVRVLLLAVSAAVCLNGNWVLAASHASTCTCPNDPAEPAARRLFEAAATETCPPCGAATNTTADAEAEAEADTGAAAENDGAAAEETPATRRAILASHTEEELCPAEMAGRRRLFASHEDGEHEACCCEGTQLLHQLLCLTAYDSVAAHAQCTCRQYMPFSGSATRALQQHCAPLRTCCSCSCAAGTQCE